MVDQFELWARAGETMEAVMPFYWEAMRGAIADSDAGDDWFVLSYARGSDPAPFTVERYHGLYPYTTRERIADTLERLTQVEMLERVGDGAYRLTDRGRDTIEGIFGAAHQALASAKVPVLPTDEMDRLNGLLRRLVQAALEAEIPEDKWALTYSRWTDPGEEAARVARLDQHITDLLRFRDDVHLAAWKPYGVDGPAWEALTFIWREEAHTAETLAETLSFRAVPVEGYRAALEDLADRGWVVEGSDGYQLTDEGQRIREEAEEDTDAFFFAGWSALGEDEMAELGDLLARAKDTLEAAARRQAWDLAGQVARSIYPAAQDVVAPVVEEHGLNRRGWVYFLIVTRSLDPQPVSAARLHMISPYANRDYLESVLADMGEAGVLAAHDGGHTFTEAGRARLRAVEETFYTRLGELAPLPEEDVSQVEGLLAKLVDACLEADEPAEKPCLSAFHHGHFEGDLAPLARVDQRLDDLRAYRDDAHIAAWRPYGVDGRVWETLTLVWREEANAVDELAESRAARGYPPQAYAGALADLVDRGWVEETPDGYRVTEEGRALRQEAEETTDRLFYGPWACLGSFELAELIALLSRLGKGLQAEVEGRDET